MAELDTKGKETYVERGMMTEEKHLQYNAKAYNVEGLILLYERRLDVRSWEV